jgi:soluble lytic murein transglycosylase
MLFLSGDSIPKLVLDTTFTPEKTQTWIDSVSPGKPLTASDSIALIRGTMLARAGCIVQAIPLLNNIDAQYINNLAMQFDLANLYTYINNPTLSFRIGRRLSWRIPVTARNILPLPLFSVLFPLPYFDLVEREANRNNIDPYFVLAVMRQESIFDPTITSRAGAIGLMQIMPATGTTIANTLKDPFSPDSLYKPYINIRHGAYYLKTLLEQFDDNLVLAIASYNGGPIKAKEWFAKNKRKTYDLFIEDIGFTETRGYVKKVLANYWTYRRFSGQDK